LSQLLSDVEELRYLKPEDLKLLCLLFFGKGKEFLVLLLLEERTILVIQLIYNHRT
jgi:hypothetical protein